MYFLIMRCNEQIAMDGWNGQVSPSVVQIGTKPSIEAVLLCTINSPIQIVLFGLAVCVKI